MRIYLALLLVGCTSPIDQPMPAPTVQLQPDTMPPPSGCDAHVSLYGASGSATPTSVPFAIETSDGVNICLELDARDNIVVGHFAASTQREFDTTASMFQLALLSKDGELLQEGWDVTLGGSPPAAFANLEYGVTKGTMIEVTLHIVAKCVPLGTTIDVALFEPYE